VDATPNLYDVAVAPDGTVWAAAMGQNAIARLAPASGTFTLYELPAANSIPYGLTLDNAGNVWFTTDLAPRNYVGEIGG
jgi:streptogramin lyase